MSHLVRCYSCLGLSILAMFLPLPWLHAATLDNTTNFPEAVSPGETITIAGTFDTANKTNAVVKLYHVGTTAIVDTRAGEVGEKSITVKLPGSNLPAGRYYLTVDVENLVNQVVPGELRVHTDVKLDAAHPTTAYANGAGSFDFDVVGQDFSPEPRDDQIYISGQGGIILDEHRFKDQVACKNPVNWPCLWVGSSEKLHVVGYQAERYQGPLLLSVGVGSVRSAEKQLVLSRISETWVLVASIAIFMIVGSIVFLLVAKGLRNAGGGKEHVSPFWSFFIDKQTNSYSLSKFQLLMFSAVFIFGYLYVFLCHWLVQWQFTLPDVPSSFSGILAMSAGTAVAAAGATAARGSKGAGGVRPSAADFIATGGQVVPERFQFFVWTLVACFGFLALLVSQNPATLDKFPDFPQGLLYVMGVSAGGYLGGKVTRSPGPVIHNIAWDKDTGDPTVQGELIVQGENLSRHAEFFIDGIQLPINTDTVKKKLDLVTPTPQEQASDTSFSSQLIIKIASVAGIDLSTGDHGFRITNKDGQFADANVTVDPPVITAVAKAPPPGPAAPPPPAADAPAAPARAAPPPGPAAPPKKMISAGQTEVVIRVTGSGFRKNSTARWRPAKVTAATPLPASSVTFVDTTRLEIKLIPGDPGTGTLTVTTPNGLSAVSEVTVV
jgi:hypothetical protein